MCRAGFAAESTVDAATRHVYRPGQMKDRISGRKIQFVHELVVFKRALVAETHRTDVPASIALDAPVKSGRPVLQPVAQTQLPDLLHTLVREPFNPLARHQSVGIGFGTLTILGELPGDS